MLKYAILFLIFALPTGLTTPALARSPNSGDLITDMGIIQSDRPWVPSDGDHAPDIYKTIPPISFHSDMFGHYRPPFDFGTQDMFHVRPQTVPDEPMFHAPR